jgi:hypothetical protein
MKLDTPSIPVVTGGIVDQGEFKIKNSAIAFSILSSGLYSNKYKAILRELGCNAYDSHVEAGCPEKPFTVHLPTRLNPLFSIRDYGTGLTHDQIMNLYTTYFESTKSDSNDFVGCMGLGSKSPFSYTKNFTISAIQNGVKGVYSAYIGEQGVPSIVQLTTGPTDEPNGLEISFPVEDRNDMSQFKHEAASTYKWFATRPEITGDAVEIPELKFSQENIIDGVNLCEGNGWGAQSHAIMGNVAYPINIPEGEELPKGVRKLYNNNSFVIRFNIGDLAIAASREELGYEPSTIKSLSTKAEEIMLALEGFVEDKLTPAKTKWERNLLAAELIKTNNELFGDIVTRYVEKNPTKFIKGTVRSRYASTIFNLPLHEINKVDGLRAAYKVVRHGYHSSANGGISLSAIKPSSAEKPKHMQRKNAHWADNNWEVHSIDPNNTTILFNNEGGNILQRVRMALRDPDYKALLKGKILICAPQNKQFDKAKMLKWLKTRTGNAPIVLASQLPEVAKGSGGVSGNAQITVQKFYHRNISYHNNHWSFTTHYGKIKDLDPTVTEGKKKIYLYVPLSHKSVIKPHEDKSSPTWTAEQVHDRIESNDIHRMAKFDLENVYGLNKTSIKTVSKSKNWVNLFDYIEKKFEKVDWKNARQDVESKLVRQEFRDENFDPKKADMTEFGEVALTDSPAGRLFKAYLDSKAIITGTHHTKIQYDRVILGMQSFFPNKDFTKSAANLDVKGIEGKYTKLFADFTEEYPMLQYVDLNSGWNSTTDWKDAINYIKLVDSTK